MTITPEDIDRQFRGKLDPHDLRELKRYAQFRIDRSRRQGVVVTNDQPKPKTMPKRFTSSRGTVIVCCANAALTGAVSVPSNGVVGTPNQEV